MVKVVPFTGTLTNAGEYGKTAVLFCDVVDQFLDQNRLAYAGAAEETNLPPLA